jgi:hypothetical protein
MQPEREGWMGWSWLLIGVVVLAGLIVLAPRIVLRRLQRGTMNRDRAPKTRDMTSAGTLNMGQLSAATSIKSSVT